MWIFTPLRGAVAQVGRTQSGEMYLSGAGLLYFYMVADFWQCVRRAPIASEFYEKRKIPSRTIPGEFSEHPRRIYSGDAKFRVKKFPDSAILLRSVDL